MRFIKDMHLYEIVKIKENDVPVDYAIVFKITPDNPFNGCTSGVAIMRIDCIASPAKIHPLLVIMNEAMVNDAGILCGSDDEVNTNGTDYAKSDLHKWCITNYLNLIPEDIQNQIMTVDIPYKSNENDFVSIGDNGSKCNVFLLSTMEENTPGDMSPNRSMTLPYFIKTLLK